ncbi:MAG: AMP-binding protein [Rubrivivax sp.]|nr:AMP-binding protein [Rubrivivax sp.]
MPALLQARAAATADAPALWARRTSAGWEAVTWRQFRDTVATVAARLRALGVGRGDCVGILAPSVPDWDIAQFAAMAVGAVVVGLDPHDTDERLAQVAATCAATVVFAQDGATLDRLGAPCLEALRLAVTFVPTGGGDGRLAFHDLTHAAPAPSAWNDAHADDPALIVFTSGTTGEPKGIRYTHRQVCAAVSSILEAFPDIAPGSRLACWLPLSNLFQRMINLCAVGRGAQVFYVEDPRTLMQHVGAIAPHLLIGVPRFYEKLHAGIVDAIQARPRWQRRLAQWAIAAGDRRARALRAGAPLGPATRVAAAVAEHLVLRRLRAILGPNLRFLISGSAPMPPWLLERLHALGFLVLEAYGMSESIVPVAANRPGAFRFGTVGRPLAGSEVKLADDGELLLRGPGVFAGYLGEAGANERFDADGFLASGDYARLDADGFVSLVGRKSEVFKTSTGRRVAPAIVESHLRGVAYVEHAVLFGAQRPFVVALIVVAQAALERRLGGTLGDVDPTAAAAAVRADLAAAVHDLPGPLRPAGVVVTTRSFSVAGGQVTPNLKVRRAQVAADYAGPIDELYAEIGRAGGAPVSISRDEGNLWLLSV